MDQIILDTSDEAAKYVKDLHGWVSRDGVFYGIDERAARWAGATHVSCKDCGAPVQKSYFKCPECRKKQAQIRYDALPRKAWNGTDPVYSKSAERYFNDQDEIEDHCAEEDITEKDLWLVLCKPVFAHQIDPDEYYRDDLPEEGEVPAEIRAAFETLNAAIRACQVPLSWEPDCYAVATEGEVRGT